MKVAKYLYQKGTRQVPLGSAPNVLHRSALRITALLCLLILSFASLAFCQSPAEKTSSRPPKIEVPKENETGESEAEKEEAPKESENQRPAAEPAEASQANPMTMPEYPTEIVGIVRSIKPFPLEKVRLNEDVPSNSVFLEVCISIDKAVPVAGNHEAVVEPGAEVYS